MPTQRHPPRSRPLADRIVALARRRTFLRPRDLDAHQLPREVLRRLVAAGKLERRGRGLYALPGAPRSEHETLAVASARVPGGVICLLSALRFHSLTTQNPSEVWMAIDQKARAPNEPELPLRIVRFSGLARTDGIEEHKIDGVRIPIYGVAKTVADCFKYRRKIGIDVAIEALRDCWRQRSCSIDELSRYAAVCRVTNVMRPYLEAITASDA
jgi:predicted transcriptional regulator of viral defense system